MDLTTKIITKSGSALLRLILLVALLGCTRGVFAGEISLSIQERDIREVMQMLSREQRMNIFVADGVSGDVSVNLYDMDAAEVVVLIAESAGFVVEDLPPFLDKIEAILNEIDDEPKQIMIEAKILEISLTDNQSYGLDWAALLDNASEVGAFGVKGLADPTSAGLFARYTNGDIDLILDALKERGRLRTISTPKLLAMEGQEAETVVGTEIGYQVTTTINQVTTESIEFLESGIILRVLANVDRRGRILLQIHPEVSTAVVSDDGIPSKATTQVTTQMLVPDGKTVFLSGLIQHQVNNTREGVPGLGDLAIIGGLFSNRAKSITSTEIVVLITPSIVNFTAQGSQPGIDPIRRVQIINEIMDAELADTTQQMGKAFDGDKPLGPTETNERK
jgi:type II secretory pathway component GspD/PulD (secretin)